MMFGLGFGVSFVFLFVGPAGVVKVVLAYPRSIVPFNVFLLIPTQFGLQNNLNMPIAFQGPTPFLMKEVRSTRHYSYYYCDWLWQGKQAGGNRRRVPKREQHYESHLNQRRHTGETSVKQIGQGDFSGVRVRGWRCTMY
jgi:hypothetical protein